MAPVAADFVVTDNRGEPIRPTAQVSSDPPTGGARIRKRATAGMGTNISAGTIEDLDPNKDLRGDKWYGTNLQLGISQQMILDPHVWAMVDLVAITLQAANWEFEAATDTDEGKEHAAFLNKVLIKDLCWDDVVRKTVRGYIENGFHLAEPVEQQSEVNKDLFPKHPDPKNAVTLESINHVPAWTVYRWWQDGQRQTRLRAITQQVNHGDVEQNTFIDVAMDRIMRFTYDQEGADFSGRAILRAAYAPWKLKIAFQTIEAINHERTGVGTPSIIAGPQADDDDLDAAETILAEMRVNEKGFIVLPDGYTFTWESATGNQIADLNSSIARCNRDIAHIIRAGFLLLGQTAQTTGGSFALAQSLQGPYHLTIVGHERFFSGTFNRGQDGWSLPRRLIELNYGAGHEIPKLVGKNLPTHNWPQVIDKVLAAIKSGAVRKDDNIEVWIRNMLQAPAVDPDSVREDPAPVMMMPGNSSAPDRSGTEDENAERREDDAQKADEEETDEFGGESVTEE